MKIKLIIFVFCWLLLGGELAFANLGVENDNSVHVEYLHYRPAFYEKEKVHEPENVHPNQGGLIYIYYTNISKKPIRLAHWRWNNFDESVWRLDNLISWDRSYGKEMKPGQTSVLEINATSKDFKQGSPYAFEIISRDTWKPVVRHSGDLVEDHISIPLIRVRPGLSRLEIHVRNDSKKNAEIREVEVAGKKIVKSHWVEKKLNPYGHAIARVELSEPLRESELVIAKLKVTEGNKVRSVLAHRRAFEDFFPIGTWGAPRESYQKQRRHHIDTCVEGNDPNSKFYKSDARLFGYRSMASFNFTGVQAARSLTDHPAIACLQLSDEPDWVTHPQQVLLEDRIGRHANPFVPTMTTLCRNVTFFEYAPIIDLPSMDHYCVTAPSTSKWPTSYGTYLEETGYYTRDLKIASEPKPIWVWSQGLFDWDERPGQTVPTPEELSVQLLQNIGYGTKGILWFTFREKPGLEYPETRDAIKGWGRVLRLVRGDVLGAEPVMHNQISSPPYVDAFSLVNYDKLIFCLTNKDYKMDPSGYRFNDHKNFEVSIKLPSWITPNSVVDISPDGIKKMQFDITDGQLSIPIEKIHDSMLIVVSNEPHSSDVYRSRWKTVVADEKRDFSIGTGEMVKCWVKSGESSRLEEVDIPARKLKASSHIYVDVSVYGKLTREIKPHVENNAVIVESTTIDKELTHAAYLNPDGYVVLNVKNNNEENSMIAVKQQNLYFAKMVPSKSVVTFKWPAR